MRLRRINELAAEHALERRQRYLGRIEEVCLLLEARIRPHEARHGQPGSALTTSSPTPILAVCRFSLKNGTRGIQTRSKAATGRAARYFSTETLTS